MKKDSEGLIDVFPLQVGSGGPPPENVGKSRMQEKPSTIFCFLGLFFIFLFFINQFSSFFSAIL